MGESRQADTEPRLRVKFRNWLMGLEDEQVAALDENWDNIMDDAALDRVDSWIIARLTLAALRARSGPVKPASVSLLPGCEEYRRAARQWAGF